MIKGSEYAFFGATVAIRALFNKANEVTENPSLNFILQLT